MVTVQKYKDAFRLYFEGYSSWEGTEIYPVQHSPFTRVHEFEISDFQLKSTEEEDVLTIVTGRPGILNSQLLLIRRN
jgi:hypothetical protein